MTASRTRRWLAACIGLVSISTIGCQTTGGRAVGAKADPPSHVSSEKPVVAASMEEDADAEEEERGTSIGNFPAPRSLATVADRSRPEEKCSSG